MPKLIEFTCKPDKDFAVPYSDGYSLYSALLNQIGNHNRERANEVHNTDFASISVSGLNGPFQSSKRDNHKKLASEEEYSFRVGVTDPDEKEVFQALIAPMVLEGNPVELTHGKLTMRKTESHSRSFEELIAESKNMVSAGIESMTFSFNSPTCIQFGNSSTTEMFPHRIAVFNSLTHKWNRVCPEEFEIDSRRDELGRYLIEKPVPNTYRTHSVLVNRVYDENKGHRRPIFRQGFTGKCKYSFSSEKDEGFREKITTLAKFSEYSGVGSAVARGCGSVKVNFKGIR